MARILARGPFIAPSYLLGRAALARRGNALVLVAPGGEVRAPLTLSRAQAAGVEATGYADVQVPLIRLGQLLTPLTLERAQAAGVQSTGDV
jgi:hypothetical protein